MMTMMFFCIICCTTTGFFLGQIILKILCIPEIESFFNSLSKARRILRRLVIPRSSLVSNNVSPFRTIFLSAIDHSLVTTTGFTYDVFCELLRRFTPVFEAFTPFDYGNKIRKLVKRTRPKTIQPVDCLGLQLFYLRNRGPQWVMGNVYCFGNDSKNDISPSSFFSSHFD